MSTYKRAVRPGFTLYHEDVELLLHLPNAQFKAFILALLTYSNALAKDETPLIPQMSGWAEHIWPLISRKIERDHQEYAAKCLRKSLNRRATTVDQRQLPSVTETEAETETVTVTETVAGTEPPSAPAQESSPTAVTDVLTPPTGIADAFIPPTPQEVTAFCESEGFMIDAQRFVDFYASKGWKVGSVPMADWRASVRMWHSRDLRYQRESGGLRSFRDSLPPLERAGREMDRLSAQIKPRRRDPAIDQANAVLEQWHNAQAEDSTPLDGQELERNLAMVREMFRDAGVPTD